MAAPAAVYRPRNPQLSDYYRCVEDNFETFIQIYDEHFSRQYGFWRPYVEQVIYRYLCFLQDIFPKSCKSFFRKLQLHFPESCNSVFPLLITISLAPIGV